MAGGSTYEVKLSEAAGSPHHSCREALLSVVASRASCMSSIKTGKFPTADEIKVIREIDAIRQ